MSDLISRSESIEELEKYEKELQKDKVEAIETDDENMLFAITNQLTAICRIKRNIMNMPTAHDIDKVVEELEELPKCSTWNHNSDNVDRKKAIEIVKQGSVGTDDVCEWKSVSDGEFIQNPHTKRLYSNEPSMQNLYCNTCGNKIKVVE